MSYYSQQFVRYEDTALDPYRTAEDIYRFVGLKMNDHVHDWIRKNTGLKFEYLYAKINNKFIGVLHN